MEEVLAEIQREYEATKNQEFEPREDMWYGSEESVNDGDYDE